MRANNGFSVYALVLLATSLIIWQGGSTVPLARADGAPCARCGF